MMAQLLVAGLVAVYGAFGMFAALVNAAMYGLDWQGVAIGLRGGAMLLLACGVFASHVWANRVLAALLLGGALWSFSTRHDTRFPEEPPAGRAALLVVMSFPLLYRGTRPRTREGPQNNGMQLTSGAAGRAARALH
jgi:hypothetical protein